MVGGRFPRQRLELRSHARRPLPAAGARRREALEQANRQGPRFRLAIDQRRRLRPQRRGDA